jgi:hypothetical protein
VAADGLVTVLLPSCPIAEQSRLSALRTDAPSIRTLEYACARARRTRGEATPHRGYLYEAEEAQPSKAQPTKPARAPWPATSCKKSPKADEETTREPQGDHSKDAEAAMVLINFMTWA